MTKRRFIGLGRKRRPEKKNEDILQLPDNFIFGLTNQRPDNSENQSKKKVNSEK